MSRITQYLKDTRSEMKHVSWPTRKQSIIFTILVILLSLLTSLFLGFFDFTFTTLLKKFIL